MQHRLPLQKGGRLSGVHGVQRIEDQLAEARERFAPVCDRMWASLRQLLQKLAADLGLFRHRIYVDIVVV